MDTAHSLLKFRALPDPSDFEDREWRQLANDIYGGTPSDDPIGSKEWYATVNHRKVWETTQVARGLILSGAVHDGAIGLGVGVGVEPLTFFLAGRVGRLLATDLYGFGWSSAPLDMLFVPGQFAPYEFSADRLSVLQMNGTNLLLPNASVDFVYSVSSIEHFGGQSGAARHISQARRVLRPGGVLVFSTEFAILGTDIPDWCYTTDKLNRLIASSGLDLIHSPPEDPHRVLLNRPATLLLPQWNTKDDEKDRLSLRKGDFVYVPVVIVLRKASDSQ